MSEKKISSCVILYDPIKQQLLCGHPTGRPWKTKDGVAATGVFSFLKGEIDEKENAETAAIREIKEESGIKLDLKKLKYLGKYEYLEYKDLEMFYYPIDEDEIDIKKCKCESYFEANGKMLPEINGFIWLHIESELHFLMYAQQKVFKRILTEFSELF
jgi:predicted NUDIX family NTP pyrophosphohydrolase